MALKSAFSALKTRLSSEERRGRETSAEAEAARRDAQRAEEELAAAQSELASRPSLQSFEQLTEAKEAWGQERQVLIDRLRRGDDPQRPNGVVILFDAANLGAGARALGGHLDFAALRERLAAGRPLRACVAFAVAAPGPERERFAAALQAAGIKVRFKQAQTFSDGSRKADWDIAIAIEALAWAGRAEAVVIASGDGDFLPLIAALRGRETSLEAAAWPGRVNAEWRASTANFHTLSNADLL